MTNPISYSSNDYDSVMADINADPELVDRPEWFKRLIAGTRDVSNVYENSIANQSFLRTAFTRQAVADLCRLIDYDLRSQSTGTGNIIFHLDPSTFPGGSYAFTAADLVAKTAGSLSVSSMQFEARTGQTVSILNETFTASAGTSRLTVAGAYHTGDKVRLTTTTTLPAPLALNTDYYVIYYSATQIYLAVSVVAAFQGTHITLTDAGTGTHTIYLYSFTQLVYQQQTLASATPLGTANNTTSWQTFRLPDKYILDDTLVITINSGAWTKVDTFVNSITTDKHYKLIHLENGDSMIMFGNGTYGVLPGNFIVYAQYATGGGNTSNINAYNRVNTYAGGNSYINGVTNAEYINGGADEQSIDDAKIVGPMLLKARARDITLEDTKYLSENYLGVLRAGVNSNAYGLLSQQVMVIPNGGGTPSPTLLTNLAAYLTALTELNSIYTVCVAPTYVSVSPVATVKILSGYTWTTVQGYVVLGFRLLFSEITKEIVNAYSASGIAAAILYINNKWSTSFTSADNNAITRMILNVTPADFGTSFAESDVVGFIDSFVTGVDYLIISSPSFPITIASTEISTDNVSSSNITQIP